jgi:hypothetical protein
MSRSSYLVRHPKKPVQRNRLKFYSANSNIAVENGQFMDLLQITNHILDWPKVNLWDVLLGVISITIFLSLLSIVLAYYRIQQINKRLWYMLYERAMKKGLSQKEIHLLESVFSGVKKSLKQQANSEDRGQLKKLLLDRFLSGSNSVSIPEVVKILEKLFSQDKYSSVFIKSIRDIHPEEYCGVLLLDTYYFGTVKEVLDTKIIIELVYSGEMPQEAKLYIYRANTGSYSLNGKIQSFSNNLLTLDYVPDTLTFSGGEHLMAIVDAGITLSTILPGSKERQPVQSYSIVGSTNKISDRAFQIRLPDHPYLHLLIDQDSLEATVIFTDGNSTHCIGKLIRSEISGHIFKISYIHPEEKKKLVKEIFSNHPIKERII